MEIRLRCDQSPAWRALLQQAAGRRGRFALSAAFDTDPARFESFSQQAPYVFAQTMLAALEMSGNGDIFLPADISYVTAARAKGLVRETVELAEMSAVIAVAKGNPRGVRSLEDLQKGGVRVVLANPELAAISKLTSEALPPQTWQALTAGAVTLKPTVNDAANDVVLGAADAAIVWNVTVLQTKGLEAVVAPELVLVRCKAAGAVAASSRQPAAAMRFLRWLASPEKGGPVFSKHGYIRAAARD